MFIHIIGHCFDDFYRDESPEEHNLRVLAVPLIHDFSVDCCIKVAVVTLTDYSLETPHWIIHLR